MLQKCDITKFSGTVPSVTYCAKDIIMIQSYQDRIKVTKTKTRLCMVSVSYQRPVVGGRSLCLKDQP